LSTSVPSLPLGLELKIERVVVFEWTIAHIDARLPAILSTPAMIGLMEMAAAHAVQSALPEGMMTLGTRIEIDHLKSCPVGATVHAWARLEKIDGRFLYFAVEARHGELILGRGRVGRAIVDAKKFATKFGA
jgi:fluoroacetyl-CoA thioesterase